MPNVNPEILIWAREAAGLSIEDACKKLQIRDSKTATAVEKLGGFENGDKAPSRSLLVRMSKQYRKPLLTFYLEKPPRRGDRGEDFRTLPEGFLSNENVYVDVLIRDIKARQSVLRETLIDEDEAHSLEFIGRARMQHSIFDVAASIRQSLNFDLTLFRNSQTVEDAFKHLRELAEKAGIYVLLVGNLGSYHTNINTEIFRGFVLADDIAPFIVINDQDSKAAWSFTLLHEITHLWLGQTGISGAFAENKVEKFCDDVASEILLPHKEFSEFSANELNFDALTLEISDFAQMRKISSKLVSYRLLRQGSINKTLWADLNSYYTEKWRSYRENQRARNKRQDGGPNYFLVRRHKLGNALVRFAQRMMHSGALSTTKAGLLLGVKPLKVHKLFESGQAV